MPERTPEDSNVSKIVADALKYTANALADWLDHPIDEEDVHAFQSVASREDRPVAAG